MSQAAPDPAIARQTNGTFAYPLGVYPIEPMTPRPGYLIAFEPADGGEEGDEFEEWPDRYVVEVVISATRMPALMRACLQLAPPRVYPILDVMGHDAYREIDPYIAYELIGLDRLWDGMRRYAPFLFEDGLCGFGAMCDDPFYYAFLDEHKILTLRIVPEMKDRLERVLRAFDLEPTEDPLGADAAAHEHRSVLLVPDDRPDLPSGEEIVERLRDDWRLVLNIDPETNVDDDGKDLGITPWRCLVRVVEESRPEPRYAEIVLWAECLRQAEETAAEQIEKDEQFEPDQVKDLFVVAADRMAEEHFGLLRPALPAPKKKGSPGKILRQRWLE